MPRGRRNRTRFSPSPGGKQNKDFRSWDRFCNDTSVLGVRYLHSKYKGWFRIIWIFLLLIFMALTTFQIYKRFSFYLIEPLTVDIKRENMDNVSFPHIIVCNQMQMRISGIGGMNRELLKLMSTIVGEDIEPINSTLAANKTQSTVTNSTMKDFKDMDMLELLRTAQQPQKDFVIGCLWQIGRPCVIEEIQGPMGLCFKLFPNDTEVIKRPGPENTLEILLNVETREAMPGFGSIGAQIFLVPSDSDENFVPYYRGFHLSEGRDLSISITETRILERHKSQCGTLKLQTFSNYSQTACQWEKLSLKIEEKCKCTPIFSSRLRNAENASDFHSKNASARICNLPEQFTCAKQGLENTLEGEGKECPADCQEKEYASIMVGSTLGIGDTLAIQPLNWKEQKTMRLREFNAAFQYVPLERVGLVKNIRDLAVTASDFLEEVGAIFHVRPSSNGSAPCIFNRTNDILKQTFMALMEEEIFWNEFSDAIMTAVPVYLQQLLYVLNSDMFGPVAKPDVINVTEEIDIMKNVKLNISHEDAFLWVKKNTTVLNVLVKAVSDSVNDIGQCIENVGSSDIKSQCKSAFERSFQPFADLIAHTDKMNDSAFYQSYKQNADNLAGDLHKVMYSEPLLLIQPGRMDLTAFANKYQETGDEFKRVQGLLDSRTTEHTNIVEKIDKIVPKINYLFNENNRIVNTFPGLKQLRTFAGASYVAGIEAMGKCLKNAEYQLKEAQKHKFLKPEWLVRLKQASKEASAYSDGPGYDQVNLLLLKIYYSQLRRETVIQTQSYDIWVLLAEIGGTIGLYFGATLVTILEVIVFLNEGAALKSKTRDEESSMEGNNKSNNQQKEKRPGDIYRSGTSTTGEGSNQVPSTTESQNVKPTKDLMDSQHMENGIPNLPRSRPRVSKQQKW